MITGLAKALSSACDWVSECRPLQQFVATNPLDRSIALPFFSAIKQHQDYQPIRGTLLLSEYYQLFHDCHIQPEHLKQSWHHYFADRHSNKQSLLPASVEMIDQLVHMMTDPTHVDYLVDLDRLSLEWVPQHRKLLRCWQVGGDLLWQQVNQRCWKFLSCYFNQQVESFQMVSGSSGIYHTWHHYFAPTDDAFFSDTDYLSLIEKMVRAHQIDDEQAYHMFCGIFYSNMGWSRQLKWLKNQHQVDLELGEILAVWLAEEKLLLSRYFPDDSHQEKMLLERQDIDRYVKHYLQQHHSLELDWESHHDVFSLATWCQIWQHAWELADRQPLLEQLANSSNQHEHRSQVQWLFCMDPRSEPWRRYVESQLGHQTFGAAGSFHLDCHHQDKLKKSSQLHVMAVLKQLKNQWLPPLLGFEVLGYWMFFYLCWQSLAGAFICSDSHSDSSEGNLADFLADDANQLTAQLASLFHVIGLSSFAPIVILCGHQSTGVNNPFLASLQCGACGGESGSSYAKEAVDLLNHSSIRQALQLAGISIPDDTLFVAAVHDTSLQQLRLINAPKELSGVERALQQFSHTMKVRDHKYWPYATGKARSRAYNWSSLVPEKALVYHRVMIIGPRWLTSSVDLQETAFLHDYQPKKDLDGSYLTQILLGPMMVAYHINLQYYFSTTDPQYFGAGDKTIHQVIPGWGVMEGNLSDLKIGFPKQGLFSAERCIHQPKRLRVLVYAQSDIVEKILQHEQQLGWLVNNEWIDLEVLSLSKS